MRENCFNIISKAKVSKTPTDWEVKKSCGTCCKSNDLLHLLFLCCTSGFKRQPSLNCMPGHCHCDILSTFSLEINGISRIYSRFGLQNMSSTLVYVCFVFFVKSCQLTDKLEQYPPRQEGRHYSAVICVYIMIAMGKEK